MAGFRHEDRVDGRQRLMYFNLILLALPLVYFAFVIIDIESFSRSLSTWAFDQFAFFLFTGICLFCLYFNHLGWIKSSKIFFLVSWPLILHIIPIIVQETPSDYYYAFPIGLIFHAILIQSIISDKHQPMLFWVLIAINFIVMVYFLEILTHFDTNNDSPLQELTEDPYFLRVEILYWLLINAVIFFLLKAVDLNVNKGEKAKQLIKTQRDKLETALINLKETKDHLIRSEKLASLGVFTAGISHELNNPINIINGGVHTIMRHLEVLKKASMEKNEEVIDSISEIEHWEKVLNLAIQRTTNIITTLGNYASPGSNVFIDYNIINCIKDALILLQSNYDDRIVIKENFDEELMIRCNPSKIDQLFFNLINNAIQAIIGNGNIEITCTVVDEFVEISIADDGCGIDESIAHKIYDPFFTTKEVGAGTGLGLYLVHMILEEHFGTIKMEPATFGGNIAVIQLPMDPKTFGDKLMLEGKTFS